jgi:hypothetical protein
VLSSIESSTLLSNDRLPFTTPVLPDVLAICWNVLSGFAIIKAKLALIIKGNYGTRTSRFEEMTSAKVRRLARASRLLRDTVAVYQRPQSNPLVKCPG